ncbi:hypothetical protein BN440_3282 [Erwinia amylovora MR1]|nr:hypothetical protein BN440_3282 [Erwinia amylovora MR1]
MKLDVASCSGAGSHVQFFPLIYASVAQFHVLLTKILFLISKINDSVANGVWNYFIMMIHFNLPDGLRFIKSLQVSVSRVKRMDLVQGKLAILHGAPGGINLRAGSLFCFSLSLPDINKSSISIFL